MSLSHRSHVLSAPRQVGKDAPGARAADPAALRAARVRADQAAVVAVVARGHGRRRRADRAAVVVRRRRRRRRHGARRPRVDAALRLGRDGAGAWSLLLMLCVCLDAPAKRGASRSYYWPAGVKRTACTISASSSRCTARGDDRAAARRRGRGLCWRRRPPRLLQRRRRLLVRPRHCRRPRLWRSRARARGRACGRGCRVRPRAAADRRDRQRALGRHGRPRRRADAPLAAAQGGPRWPQ